MIVAAANRMMMASNSVPTAATPQRGCGCHHQMVLPNQPNCGCLATKSERGITCRFAILRCRCGFSSRLPGADGSSRFALDGCINANAVPRTRPARCCAGSQDRHAARTAQAGSTMRQRDTGNAVDQFIDIRPAHQFAPLLHQAQLQHLGLDRDVGGVGLRCAAIAAARAASIAGRQRGSGRAGSRHLAAGSRLRLRACRCRSGCNRGAAPVPTR